MNQELCQKDQQPHEPNGAAFDEARRQWESLETREIELREALDLCRRTHKTAPFKFFNGNTMAAMARQIIAQELDAMPPLLGQMARTTVAHYVVGAIKAGEVEAVLDHVEDAWRKQRPAGAPPSAP